MGILFDSFAEWGKEARENQKPLWECVLDYEIAQKGSRRGQIFERLAQTYAVMKDAVATGLSQDMRSRSGMIDNGGKKVRDSKTMVLSPEFTRLIANTLAAKELNSCMGRVVAAPTAGASGIMPGVLTTLQEIHGIPNDKIYEAILVGAGIALIIAERASISGAVGGCQAETGTAAAMGAGAIVHCMGGTDEQVFTAVAITIMNMLGLVCDPVAGLVEVPCVKRNASASVIAFASAQIALAGDDAVIPVDEVIDAMGEIGHSLESKYKETAQGGLAATPSGRKIAEKILTRNQDVIEES